MFTRFGAYLRQLPSLREGVVLALLGLGLTLVGVGATTTTARLVLLALCLVAGLVLWIAPRGGYRGALAWVASLAIVAVAIAAAYWPQLFGDNRFCEPDGGTVGICARAADPGHALWSTDIRVGPSSVVVIKGMAKAFDTRSDHLTVSIAPDDRYMFVDASLRVANSTTHGTWSPVPKYSLVKPGVDMGSYAPDSNVFFTFAIQIANQEGIGCGTKVLPLEITAASTTGTSSTVIDIAITRSC